MTHGQRSYTMVQNVLVAPGETQTNSLLLPEGDLVLGTVTVLTASSKVVARLSYLDRNGRIHTLETGEIDSGSPFNNITWAGKIPVNLNDRLMVICHNPHLTNRELSIRAKVMELGEA